MKRISISIFTTILLLGIASAAIAIKVPTPEPPPEGVTIISIDSIDTLMRRGDAHVFDMRHILHYRKGHLPGAISLPYEWIKKNPSGQHEGAFDITQLPSDKNANIIFHSDDPSGWKSYYAAKAAREAGYVNVLWLRSGYTGWVERGYAVER